jgi:hypothetical protein
MPTVVTIAWDTWAAHAARVMRGPGRRSVAPQKNVKTSMRLVSPCRLTVH